MSRYAVRLPAQKQQSAGHGQPKAMPTNDMHCLAGRQAGRQVLAVEHTEAAGCMLPSLQDSLPACASPVFCLLESLVAAHFGFLSLS
jgi:hypothetical protein